MINHFAVVEFHTFWHKANNVYEILTHIPWFATVKKKNEERRLKLES